MTSSNKMYLFGVFAIVTAVVVFISSDVIDCIVLTRYYGLCIIGNIWILGSILQS